MSGEAPVPVGMRDASTTKNEGINDDDDDDDDKDAESEVRFGLNEENIKEKRRNCS